MRFLKIFIVVVLIVTPLGSSLALAQQYQPILLRGGTSEKVRVIKMDKTNHDLVVERTNGEKLLIQHHYTCSSMSTEFPVTLIRKNNKIVRVKVAFNEMCTVYNTGPYSDEGKLLKRLPRNNLKNPEHEAELQWRGRNYRIDYGPGCQELRNFIRKRVYLHLPNGNLKGGTLYLPAHRGQCLIKNATFLDQLNFEPEPEAVPLTNVQYLAQKNQAEFYWEDPIKPVKKEDGRLYLISYSRYSVDPDKYHWTEMPNLKMTRDSNYKVKQLKNDRTYFFYLAAMDKEGRISEWQDFEVTPEHVPGLVNDYLFEDPFEIELVEETNTYYRLKWHRKENARKHMVKFYVDGKREFLKYINNNQIVIQKKPEYEGKRFRLTVKTLKKNRYKKSYFDGHVWWDGKDYIRKFWRDAQN